tara:strand:- start:11430 stop:12680 length:1251 start_codon:yes stop_codon:yes gene_type:complete
MVCAVKVKNFKMSGGEPYVILLGNDGIPLCYPNLFVTSKHRNVGDSTNTCRAVFARIAFLLEILKFMNIDLEKRLRQGETLKDSEVELLLRYARFKVKEFREHVVKNQAQNVHTLATTAKSIKTKDVTFVVQENFENSSGTIYNRITTFAQYIGWLESEIIGVEVSRTESRIKARRPKKVSTSFVEYKSLTEEQVAKVLDVVSPHSDQNPWPRDIHLRHRNHLLIKIFNDTGARRGEVAKLKISDLITDHTSRRYFNITKEADNSDIRSDRPEAKTLGRKFPIGSRLNTLLDDYIIDHRSQVYGSEHIEYLFVTHHLKTKRNNALSLPSIGKIFRDISEVVGFAVSPHSFRHTWNDRFSQNADNRIARGETTPAKAEKDRQKLMGWTESSKMAMYYSRRYADDSAYKTGLLLQGDS